VGTAAIGGSDHHVNCYHIGRYSIGLHSETGSGPEFEIGPGRRLLRRGTARVAPTTAEIGVRRCEWRGAAAAALQQRKLSTAALETTDPEPNRPIVELKTVEALLDGEVLHANEELTARHVGRGRAANEQ